MDMVLHYFAKWFDLLECEMEMLFNTAWPQSYIGTELTHPCIISESN